MDGFIFIQGQDFMFPLVEFHEFPSDHFSRLLTSLWMAAQPVVSATSSCVSSADFLRVYSTIASSSLIKISSTVFSIDMWNTEQGTRIMISGLQLDFGLLMRTLRAPQFIHFSVDLKIHLPI